MTTLWAILAVALQSLPVPYVAQPPGPFCTAAAASMVAGAHGLALEPLPLAREVPVAADGISWVDLADALATRGLTVRVVQMDAATLRRTVDAGQPVIVSIFRGPGKHVWVVTGSTLDGYALLDPAQPAVRQVSAADLESVWAGHQAIVVLGPKSPGGLPQADWEAQHRRFAALEWGLRAEAVGLAPGDAARALALYDRAIAQDAHIAALHNNRGLALAALGRKRDAASAFREALRQDSAYTLARKNLAALGR